MIIASGFGPGGPGFIPDGVKDTLTACVVRALKIHDSEFTAVDWQLTMGCLWR